MMSAMKFSHEIQYTAAADDVYAMLAEQAFREQVCDACHAVDRTVQITPSADGMDVVVDQTLPGDGIPSFAKKLVGDRIQVVQSERWTSPTFTMRCVIGKNVTPRWRGGVDIPGSGIAAPIARSPDHPIAR